VGRNGTLKMPAALLGSNLSGRSGAGLDPCSALHAVFELEPNESREIILLLGEAGTRSRPKTLFPNIGTQ